MRAVYRLPVKQGLVIPVPLGTNPIAIESTEVRWEVDDNNHLKFVIIMISGMQIRHESTGAILSSYPELEDLAFRLGAYIANSILIQTGFDAIDAKSVLLKTPEILPETPEEEKEITNSKKTNRVSLESSYSIRREFRPIEYSRGFSYSAAIASYADGLRVSSPFQQYEQFYKVVEHFFGKKEKRKPPDDTIVSRHARQYDPRYDKIQIEKLRFLRNRCAHPQSPEGHVNPESLVSIREIKDALPVMRDLALLLLNHPPPLI